MTDPLLSKTRDGIILFSSLMACLIFVATAMAPAPAYAASPCGAGFVYCELTTYEVLPGDLLAPDKTLARVATIYEQMSASPISPENLSRWNDLEHEPIKAGTKLVIFYAPKDRQPKKKISRKKRSKKSTRQEKAAMVESLRSNFKKTRVQNRHGMVQPYPLDWIIRGFGKCVNGKREHPAVDIAGVGPKYGLGTPVRAMVQSKVVSIHLPEHNPARYGTRDKRDGIVRRFGTALPRSMNIPGYGEVHFFTRDLGSARTGVMIVTQGMGGGLKNHVIRYMHLGAVHPSLKAGSILNAGDELGVMGSTAILESVPHVHIDITDPKSKRLDVAEILGMGIPVEPCGRKK